MYDRTKFLIVAVATAVLAGCTSAPPGPVATPADTVYHGGPIVTDDDPKPTAEAVAVRGGKIVAVGSRAEVLALKGSITVGKLADLVILSANPLTVPPATINKVVVLETIKDGKMVYTRKAQP
jgi:predicted amidohydrolase YtcJ